MNNTDIINKPISLIMEDAKNTIINTINDLNLHPTLLEVIMKDIYKEVNDLAKSQYERERAEYEQALAEQNNIEQNNIIEEQNNIIEESTE